MTEPDRPRSAEEVQTEIAYLRAEVEHLRRRAADFPGDNPGVEGRRSARRAARPAAAGVPPRGRPAADFQVATVGVEFRLSETQARLSAVTAQNERLSSTL